MNFYYFSLSSIQSYFLNALNFINYHIPFLMPFLISFFFTVALIYLFLAQWGIIFNVQARPMTPENHKKKGAMVSMGGVFILISLLLTCFLCIKKTFSGISGLFILNALCFGVMGFIDDFYKMFYKKWGISALNKWIMQVFVALTITILWLSLTQWNTHVTVPFFSNAIYDVGFVGFFVWITLIMLATVNAVNMTDGLDGLATGVLIPNIALFSMIHYWVDPTSPIVLFGAALLGALLGFLWYNCYPAKIIMGDTGSLFLGATLALLAITSKYELLLPFSGVLFVSETMSVILQVASFRYRGGKRIFKMAPIHHHFELSGMHENTITTRFSLITLLLCLTIGSVVYFYRMN